MQEHGIIQTGGKQYLVKPGTTIDVEKLVGEVGASVTFPDVLNGTTVVGTIVDHGRAAKIRVVKFHNKTRSYRRHGHRQHFTKVKIESFGK